MLPRRKPLFIVLLLFCLIYMTDLPSHLYARIYYYFHQREAIHCYHLHDAPTLPDITASPSPTDRARRSIFFHETSCNSYFEGKVILTAREACAIESAAILNPNMDVYVIFASPGTIRNDGTQSDRFIKILNDHKNVHLRHINFDLYTKNTPVEKLYRDGLIDESWYAQSHASDVLRYLTLWKYGGIYLDLDVVLIKSLESLPPNFAGIESADRVAAGVISFDRTGSGHELANNCMRDIQANFSGKLWGTNGPGVVTRLAHRICGANRTEKMKIGGQCGDFRIYSAENFYPIAWWKWHQYFDSDQLIDVLNKTKTSYAIHVWNKLSASKKAWINELTAYTYYAKRYCPNVFNECDAYF